MPKFSVDDFLDGAHALKERGERKVRDKVIKSPNGLTSHQTSPLPPPRPSSPLFDGINEEGFKSEQFPSFYLADRGEQSAIESEPPHCYIHCRRRVCCELVAKAKKTVTEPVLSSPRLPDQLDSNLVQSILDATENNVSSEAFDIQESDLQSIIKLVRAYAGENLATGSGTFRKLATPIKKSSGFRAMAYARASFFDCMSRYFSWSMEHPDGSGRLEVRTVTTEKLMEEIELRIEPYLMDYMERHGRSYLRLVKDIQTISPLLIPRRFKDIGAINQVWDYSQCMVTMMVKILQWRHLQLQAASAE